VDYHGVYGFTSGIENVVDSIAELLDAGHAAEVIELTEHALRRCGAQDNPPVQPVHEDLIEPVKRHVSRQVAAMIDLQLLTGARPGEIVQMRPRDIDRTGPTWTYHPSETPGAPSSIPAACLISRVSRGFSRRPPPGPSGTTLGARRAHNPLVHRVL